MTQDNICCIDGHSKTKASKQRDSQGRFITNFSSMIPEQCWKCKCNVHHECKKQEDCGCDCAEFVE